MYESEIVFDTLSDENSLISETSAIEIYSDLTSDLEITETAVTTICDDISCNARIANNTDFIVTFLQVFIVFAVCFCIYKFLKNLI